MNYLRIENNLVPRYSESVNKDHQRMMVNLMFMIVQNESSFLTAINPSAGAPAVVILLEFT